jgi:peptidyl-tRNA hydrolase, PTH1 family
VRRVKLIVGLGNPGIEYQFTPHNMGYLAVDRIAEKLGGIRIGNRHCRALTGRGKIGNEEVLLAKPETFMNLSGLSVRELVEKYEAEPAKDLIVLYDELDFEWGTMRIRERGSSAGHNGVESIMGAVGPDFIRIRMGIGPGHTISNGADYVLAPMKKKQLEVADEMLERAADAVKMIVEEGVSKAMNTFNQRAKESEEES